MSPPRTVASIGDNCLDEYLDAGTGRTTFVGGNAVNVAVGLAAANRPTNYFGAVGDDPAGRRVCRELAIRGVDVSRVRTVADGTTGLTRIRLTPDGDRVFESEDFGTSAGYLPTTAEFEVLRGCAAAHIGLVADAATVRHHLADADVLVTQDCSVAEGFHAVDVAFCSEAIAGDAGQTAQRAIHGGARLCVVTRGSAGSIAFDGTRWWECPAELVDVIDTTGAGDSFVAGFIDSYLDTRDVGSALRAGSSTAARTCSRLGAWPPSVLPFE